MIFYRASRFALLSLLLGRATIVGMEEFPYRTKHMNKYSYVATASKCVGATSRAT